MNPIVSIIIPIYNAENYIFRCLKSINSQTFSNFEVILVDDGSKDNSNKIIVDFIKDKPNWLLFSKQNEGTSMARNFGIDKAKGNFINFIDADDFVENTYLERLYISLNESNSDLACCGYYDHSNHGVVALNNFSGNSAPTIGVNEFSKLLFSQIGGVLWDKLFSAKIIKENKLKMNQDIYYYEDSLFVLDYLLYAKTISLVEEPLYNYNRVNEQSYTKKINYKWKQNTINFNSEIEKKLNRLNFSIFEIMLIVSRNISVFILSVIEYEKLSKYSFYKKHKIVTIIMNDPFLRKHFKGLNAKPLYKPFHFFFKYRMTFMIIFYSWLLNTLRVGYRFYTK